MKSFFLSIVIPAYNAESYLARCLDSILEINSSSIEIIVVNDGSEDDTENILKQYVTKGIKYKTIANSGVSVARNTGIAMAMGEYITFVDADDTVLSEDYRKLLQEIQKSDFSDLYMFSYSIDDERTKEYVPCLAEGKYGKEGINTLAQNLLDVKIAKRCPSKYMGGKVFQYLVKKELFQDNGLCFPEKLPYAEDLCYCLHMFNLASTLTVIHKVVYNYHINSGSASHRFRINWWNEWMGVCNYLEQFNVKSEQMNRLQYWSAKTIIMSYATSKIERQTIEEKTNIILADSRLQNAMKGLNFQRWTFYENIENILIRNQKTFLLLYFEELYIVIRRIVNKLRRK